MGWWRSVRAAAVGSKAWRHAACQVGLVRPRATPDTGELADWAAISPALCPALQAIPVPTEPAPAEYWYDWQRRPCGAGYGSRYLKASCQHPSCGYQVRVTRKWLALGAPWYPVAGHGQLVLVTTGAHPPLRTAAPLVPAPEPVTAQSEELA